MTQIDYTDRFIYTGPGNPTHGRSSTYRSMLYKCRCEPCTEANRAEQTRQNVRRAARLAADPTLAPHGDRSTYTNWGCRCEPCTEVHARHCALRNNARAMNRLDIVS